MNLLWARQKILMARQYIFWPQLATGSHGGFAKVTASSRLFGNIFADTTNSDNGKYIEWADVVLSPGTWQIEWLGDIGPDYGIGHVSFAGVDTGARLDQYNGTAVVNSIVSDTFVVNSRTRGTLRLDVDSTTGGNYRFGCIQVCLTKITPGQDEGRSIDDLPWHYDVPPWSYEATTVGVVTATQSNTYFWGTRYEVSAQNDHLDYRVFLPAGTYTMRHYAPRSNNRGISTVTLDGSSIGTIDLYAGAVSQLTTNIAGIVVPTTGSHNLVFTQATKHGSSSGYVWGANWLAFRRTA